MRVLIVLLAWSLVSACASMDPLEEVMKSLRSQESQVAIEKRVADVFMPLVIGSGGRMVHV
jgi:hypothetical protein